MHAKSHVKEKSFSWVKNGHPLGVEYNVPSLVNLIWQVKVEEKKLGPPFNLGVRKIDDVFRETNSPSNVIDGLLFGLKVFIVL